MGDKTSFCRSSHIYCTYVIRPLASLSTDSMSDMLVGINVLMACGLLRIAGCIINSMLCLGSRFNDSVLAIITHFP